MLSDNRCRWFLLIIPIGLAIAIYPLPFSGKQLVSLDAPLQSTFDVLVSHLWQLHPFVSQVENLEQINETCTSYQITDRLAFILSLNFNVSSTYYVQLNIDRANYCLTSQIQTPWGIMHAYHQYCMHTNTLKPTTTIITDQFHGKSWTIFMFYIRMKMFESHKYTLDQLRKEMRIYSTE
jgi:hypothetical protein